MLKIKILTALIILTINNNGNCQEKSQNDKSEIHKNVVKALDKEGVKFSVSGFTKKRVLSGFDFGGGGGLDTTSNRTWNKKNWIEFVKSIDTASITDYPLNIHRPFGNNIKIELIFAPIIFSKENDKALCIFKLYNISNRSEQVTAWYYGKKKGRWMLEASQIVSTND